MIILIDNYDSFVYNLARYFAEMGCQTLVARNDKISVSEVRSSNPAAVILSPGPCTPQKAGLCVEVVQELGCSIPILGVCLGHQVICAAYGGDIVRAAEPIHGRTSPIYHCRERLFADIPNPLQATRYHSLVVSEQMLTSDLVVTARLGDGTVMAVEHRSYSVFGVQFHPESVLTQTGHRLLRNFLELAGIPAADYPDGDYVQVPQTQILQADDRTSHRPIP